ncbi:hypothetical protein M409DRAFT_57632 [Zasmidium cellare ATCC 36951]|uniref:Major facilitator superfamily (MFS) profile domain-containing protein n=1 Tax=Zasmidium cellare ATCC 36951 TaxID=1080233 RepID=A0A6A6CBR6_ZASCE|nr:uncharacterized protein M409DRAFT_57632 [Zasmidium cellare ATCC 36951]KAF2163352.1 hypothetical protein M409DRAFT_57632 [Zasmidium cellare ATCC 36951]
METIGRVFSRPQAKPYRTRKLSKSIEVHLDERGLLKFSPNDVENPKNWSAARRCYITAACIVTIMNGSMASSSPSGCLPSISEKLHVSQEVAKLTVTLFVVGFAAGPAFWAPLSEYFGRRGIFVGTFVCYFAFTFLCAFTPNIGGLLVGRFLCGTFISGALSNTPGVFADIWGPIERNLSMALFTIALDVGPAVGPITSGFYQLKLDWRWSFYQLLWVSGFTLFILPTVPETLQSRCLLHKARRLRKIPGYEHIKAPIEVEGKKLSEIFKTALLRPWRIVLDPIAGLTAIYITVVYTLLYMLFTIFPIAFIEIRGWNAGVGELPLLSVVVGALISGVYVYARSFNEKKKIQAGHKFAPEDSLPVGMVGAICFPVGMFLLAWGGMYADVHWIVASIGGVFVSIAITLLFIAFLNYLSESYLMYAASAQAGNQIIRSAIAASAPLFSSQMFSKMTLGGGGSMIGGISILLAPIPFIFYRYGAKIRQKSKFAPTPEVEEKEEKEVEKEVQEGEQDEENEKQEEVETPGFDNESLRSEARFNDSDEIEKGEKRPDI